MLYKHLRDVVAAGAVVLSFVAVPTRAVLGQEIIGIKSLPDADTDLVGGSFHFDPVEGGWRPLGRVAMLSKPAAEGTEKKRVPLEETITFGHGIVTEISRGASSVALDFEGSFGVVKTVAQYASTSQNESRYLATEMSLTWTKKFKDRIYLGNGPVDFTEDAKRILAISGDSARNKAWKKTFGEYIAVGTQSVASITMKVRMTDFSSSQSQSEMASFAAMSAKAEGKVSFADFWSAASMTKKLTYELSATGVDTAELGPHTHQTFSSLENQEELLKAITRAMASASVDKGLILYPKEMIPGLSTIEPVTPMGRRLILDAAKEARSALAALLASEAWFYPQSKLDFVASLTKGSADVGAGEDVKEGMIASNAGLRSTLETLWTTIQDFYEEKSDEARALVHDQVKAVRDDRAKLAAHTAKLQELIKALPQNAHVPTTNKFVHWGDLPSSGGEWHYLPVEVTLDGVAFFTDGSPQDIVSVLQDSRLEVKLHRGGGPTAEYSYPDEAGMNLAETKGIKSLRAVVDPSQTETFKGLGLQKIKLSFQVYADTRSDWLELRLIDQLGRRVVVRSNR